MNDRVLFFSWFALGVLTLPLLLVLLMAPNYPACIGYCYGGDEFEIHRPAQKELD